MLGAPLFVVQCLLVTSAAISPPCAGKSCPAENDAAALLQKNVEVHDVVSANQKTVQPRPQHHGHSDGHSTDKSGFVELGTHVQQLLEDVDFDESKKGKPKKDEGKEGKPKNEKQKKNVAKDDSSKKATKEKVKAPKATKETKATKATEEKVITKEQVKALVIEANDECRSLTEKGEQNCDQQEGCNWDPAGPVCAAGCDIFPPSKPGAAACGSFPEEGEQNCDQQQGCNWDPAGSVCAAFCPDSYCFWTLSGKSKGYFCHSTTMMKFGGNNSFHKQTNDANDDYLVRKFVPQFVTTTRCRGGLDTEACLKSSNWDTCVPDSSEKCQPEGEQAKVFSRGKGGWVDSGEYVKGCKNNCFYGILGFHGVLRADLRKEKGKELVQVVAAEVNIKCEHKGEIVVRWVGNLQDGVPSTGYWPAMVKNSKLKMWYNDKPVCEDDERKAEGDCAIAISSDDPLPIFRIEVSRKKISEPAMTMILVSATEVKAGFDNCMEQKSRHGECLKTFGSLSGKGWPMSHAQQAQCICEAPRESDGALETLCEGFENAKLPERFVESCNKWRECLQLDAKTLILKTVQATNLLPSTSTALLAQDLTRTTQRCLPRTTDTFCVDPTNLDVESFDCNCFDFISTSTPDQIRGKFCENPYVCCDWKTKTRCPDLLVDSMVEVNESSMLQRSQVEKTSEGDVSLDESLSGKRCTD